MRQLPTGTLTLMFTDIEGSTRLLQQLGDHYAAVLQQCRGILRSAFQQGYGFEVDTQGDAFFVVFERALDAITSAASAQRDLFMAQWPDGVTVRVRMGLHTGEPKPAEEGYIGLDVHLAARIMSAAHGGQVLLSPATHDLVATELNSGMALRNLGEYQLKDIAGVCRLFQLVIPDLPADFPPPATLSSRRRLYNVPTPATSFVGREREIREIGDLLQQADVRLLTLIGTGGVGKTRLALRVAQSFAGNVCFVALDQLSESEGVLPAIAQALHLQEKKDKTLLELAQEALREESFLLILDNFEQVLAARSILVTLLAACPQLKILVTSRALLHIQAEHIFEVAPLPLPEPEAARDLAKLAHNAAISLFVQRAGAVARDFHLTRANAGAIAGICARLDGIPLAIELAAARMRHFSAPEILSQLEHGLAALQGTMRDIPARQQTLVATIAWSYRLLEADEQRVFRRLSVFTNGAALQAIDEVCVAVGAIEQPVADVLASLVDKSMMQRQSGKETRFWLLQTLSLYGRVQLAEAGELEAARAAHAAYYLDLAERAAPLLAGAEQIDWLDRLDADYENIRTALEWMLTGAAGKACAEQALRLCNALLGYWEMRGYFREGLTYLERTLASIQDVSPSLHAQALHGAGFLALMLDDNERAERFLRESQALFRESGDRAGMADILRLQGNLAMAQSRYKVARRLLEESLAIYQEREDRQKISSTMLALAQIAVVQSDFPRASRLLEENLALYLTMNDLYSAAYPLYYLALTYFLSKGDNVEARKLAEESLARFKDVGNRRMAAYVLALLGQVVFAQDGDAYAQTRSMIEESLASFKMVGDRYGEASALIALAHMAADHGGPEDAHALSLESWKLLRAIGAKELAALCLEGAGEAVLARGMPERAVPLWGTAATLRAAIVAPMPPVYRESYMAAVADARQVLGQEAFQSLWTRGYRTPWEQIKLDG